MYVLLFAVVAMLATVQDHARSPAATWIVVLEGDAGALRVQQIHRKPFRAARPRRAPSDFRVLLLDSAGAVIATVPLDLSRFCTDVSHRGQPPHLRGDVVQPHEIHCVVKVPARADIAALRIEDGRDARDPITICSVDRAALLASVVSGQTVKTVIDNGSPANRYDIVILGDGYQQSEESRFDADAARALDELFKKPVYAEYRSYFNAHTVFRASAESGADQPDRSPQIFKNTAYDATYNYLGTPRCLYIQNTALATADAALAPDVEGSIMVLVNDSRYGGCGGSFAVSYNGSQGAEVQAHEFGHSFAGLADEYDTGRAGSYSGPEPIEANITADGTGMTKWPLWLGSLGVGTFQGAGYYKQGLWRPKLDCLMRTLFVPYCPVCEEQTVLASSAVVRQIENPLPANASVTVGRPNTQAFSFTNLVPGASSIEWRVDGQLVASAGTSWVLDSTMLVPGKHRVTVQLEDLTPRVRNDPNNLQFESVWWDVDLQIANPGTYSTFGSGCAGSGAAPCIAVNQGGNHFGGSTLAGAKYAIAATAPVAMDITGFELQTSSTQPASTTIPISIYADQAGQPGNVLASGTMYIGPSLAWYAGSLDAAVTVPAGTVFYLGFQAPSPITASVVSGTPVGWFLDAFGSWSGMLNASWTYRVNCSQPPALIPALAVVGRPEVGGSFDLRLDTAPPNAAAGLLVGASNQSWAGVSLPFDLGALQAPGCAILASGEIVLPVVAGAAGSATVTIAVPAAPVFVGAAFHNQFFVTDVAANGLGLTWSNGGTGRIGG